MSSAIAGCAAKEIALGRLSGSVPSELGAWTLRTSGVAFEPTEQVQWKELDPSLLLK